MKSVLKPEEDVVLSRCIRIFIFLLFVFISMTISVDGGIISAASANMKKDLDFNDKLYGMIGSLIAGGKAIGIHFL